MREHEHLRVHWGIKAPIAAHGARQFPVPWPSSRAEADSEPFKAKIAAYSAAQTGANRIAAEGKAGTGAGRSGGAAPRAADGDDRAREQSAPDSGSSNGALKPAAVYGARRPAPEAADGSPRAADGWDDIAASLNAQGRRNNPRFLDPSRIYDARRPQEKTR